MAQQCLPEDPGLNPSTGENGRGEVWDVVYQKGHLCLA